jgi:hypothetical protein
MLHEAITEKVLGAAMKVHSALGAGCLESTYDACLRYQLAKNGVTFEHQARLPVIYDGIQVDAVGLLINFNVPHLRHGIKRVMNRFRGHGGLRPDAWHPFLFSSVVEMFSGVDGRITPTPHR